LKITGYFKIRHMSIYERCTARIILVVQRFFSTLHHGLRMFLVGETVAIAIFGTTTEYVLKLSCIDLVEW